MQKVRDAVRYGIETLNISPERMFSLLETSKDYEGDDYQRWLASQIIKVVENNGVGYSQLLVKRFDIIRDLIEEVEDESSMRDSYISMVAGHMRGDIFSVNVEELGGVIEDVDWFSKIDYSIGVLDFFDTLPEYVKESVNTNKVFNITLKLSTKKAKTKCDLYIDAKNRNISCKTEGALMLYRMCLLSDALSSLGISMTVTFISDIKFLQDRVNEEVLKYFLECFTYEGWVVDNKDFLVNAFIGGKKATCVCKSRSVESGNMESIQDGFVLEYGKIDDYGHFIRKCYKRYSYGSEYMRDYLLSEYTLTDDVVDFDGNPAKGINKAFGYLCLDSRDVGTLSLYPESDERCIPITNRNFRNVVVYYGVSASLGYFGISRLFPTVPDGHDKYTELFSNCLPLFLYDVNSQFCVSEKAPTKENLFDPFTSKSFISVIEKSEVFFSFEARRLYDTCYGYLKHLGEKAKGKSFEDIRHEFYDDDFNSTYLEALVHLKDFICSMYRSM